MNLLSCPDSIPNLFGFIDTSIAPRLLFYSYLPIVLLTLFAGFLVFFKDKFSLQSKLFLGISVSFSFWILLVLLQWIGVHVQVVHFAWQLLALFEILIFIFSFYFVYAFLNGHDFLPRTKQIFSLLLSLLIVLIPSKYNIKIFDFENCEGVIGYLWYFIYLLEIVTIIEIIRIGVKALYSKSKIRSRKEILLLVLGVSLFLVLFSATNIIGEITQIYEINLFGSFGVVAFLSILGYMIVRYRSFNIRVLGAQALIFALGFLVFALLFLQRVENVRVVALFTLILVLLIGRALILGIRREVEQRKYLEKLSHELELVNASLEHANEKLKSLDKLKTEFLSLASHQLRTPLTAIKGYASMLTEEAYGKLTEAQEGAVKRMYVSAEGLANLVEDLLNISKIEQGGLKFEFIENTDLAAIAINLYNELKIPAEDKGLTFTLTIPKGEQFLATVDPVKIKQALLNLADNSIKYTPKGFVELSLKHEQGKIIFEVKDSGVGISADTRAKLFEKFSRGEGGKLNTGGSGLGLYLARQISLAHKGDIQIESEGVGKGAIFRLVLPMV